MSAAACAPVALDFDHIFGASPCGPRLRQKLLDDLLRAVVIALAEMVGADAAFGVDEIMGRPVIIIEGAPDRVVIVDGDGIIDVQIGDRLLHIGDHLLEGEFRRMHADHDQTLVAILFRPGPHIRQAAQAIDAGIGPEIDQHDLALERLGASAAAS